LTTEGCTATLAPALFKEKRSVKDPASSFPARFLMTLFLISAIGGTAVSALAEDAIPGIVQTPQAFQIQSVMLLSTGPLSGEAGTLADRPERGFFNDATSEEAIEIAFLPASTDAEPTLLLRPRRTADGIPWRYADLFRFLDQIPGISSEEPAADDSLYDIPVIRTPSVESHLRFFHTAMRERFEQWLNRLSHYKPLVDKIFLEFDLPSDLVFLSLVESGFNPKAYSRARAAGPWQFMKGTARLYGLRVDQYVDERRDPIKSTVAAARYLRDLYDLFGTWPLAMAAYNAGEGKVMRALQKAQGESLWDIIRTKKHLKRETREYVPRIMAATIIAKNPDRYGFSHEPIDAHSFEEVVVRRSVHLRTVAAATGISFADLKQLNPELRRDITPPGDPEYLLKVPVGSRQAVEEKLETLKTRKPPVLVVKKAAAQSESSEWYRVRVGDSLWKIAKRFGVTVHELKEWNNLSGRRIQPGDLLALVP
jgi:membrane-bound lytic murein transglycosylase D